MADFVKVATVDEVQPGHALLVTIRASVLPSSMWMASFFALDNTYTHRGGPLAEGTIAGSEVTCPWQGATYDIRTGDF